MVVTFTGDQQWEGTGRGRGRREGGIKAIAVWSQSVGKAELASAVATVVASVFGQRWYGGWHIVMYQLMESGYVMVCAVYRVLRLCRLLERLG